MKITIFGLTLSSSWGNGHATPYRALLKALHRLGHQVTFYEKDADYYARRRDFTSCDYCNLIFYSDWDSIRAQALREASESDVVITASFLAEGACISDELLALPRPLHVFYDLDTPVTLTNLRRAPLEYLRAEQIPGFDLYLSFTGGRILDELVSVWGAQRVEALYGCVDADVHSRVDVPERFRCALSYMGTYAADRQRKLDELLFSPAALMPPQLFVLAGSMYPQELRASWPSNLRHFEHVGPNDHAALYSSSLATLNITRADMAEYGYCPSGRFFEAAACGAPMLTDYWEGLESFFRDWEEILVVHSAEEVVHALQMPSKLEQMAQRARERVLAEHTGDVRARQMLSAFNGAYNNTDAMIFKVAS